MAYLWIVTIGMVLCLGMVGCLMFFSIRSAMNIEDATRVDKIDSTKEPD
jgi:hypothetical protein